jgi:Amt family ammonium transporter
MRVDEAEEIAGLDLVEHGEQGYSDGAMGGSPILGALENSSELLARTVMASGHSAVK